MVVCDRECSGKDKERYYLGPGNHTPPEFPDNRISEAHVCVSCFLHTFIVRNHLANPPFSVQREHLYKSDKSKRTKLGIEEWNQGIEKLRGSNSSTIFNSFSREGDELGAMRSWSAEAPVKEHCRDLYLSVFAPPLDELGSGCIR